MVKLAVMQYYSFLCRLYSDKQINAWRFIIFQELYTIPRMTVDYMPVTSVVNPHKAGQAGKA